jgi:hypothetical protein
MDQDVENKMLKFMAEITVLSIFSDSNFGLLEGKKQRRYGIQRKKMNFMFLLLTETNDQKVCVINSVEKINDFSE